jgi:hypothetical protein
MTTKTTLTAALAALALAAAAATVAADGMDDDLAAVKKAVAGASSPAASAQERPAAEREPASTERRTSSPRWFRVRVVEKGAKHGRVSVNLPLGLVRAFGEDWPIRGCHRCDAGHGPTLGEVLRALDSGQSLVEIDDDNATVRVWVD